LTGCWQRLRGSLARALREMRWGSLRRALRRVPPSSLNLWMPRFVGVSLATRRGCRGGASSAPPLLDPGERQSLGRNTRWRSDVIGVPCPVVARQAPAHNRTYSVICGPRPLRITRHRADVRRLGGRARLPDLVLAPRQGRAALDPQMSARSPAPASAHGIRLGHGAHVTADEEACRRATAWNGRSDPTAAGGRRRRWETDETTLALLTL
jgi:hypothetical protein